MKNRRRAITKKPSAVSPVQCNVIAIDKKFLPGSGDPPLGDSRTEEQQADLQSAAVYGQRPKKYSSSDGGTFTYVPPLATRLITFRYQRNIYMVVKQ